MSWPLFTIGAVGIVAGGLVAAATAPSASEHGSWAAAYLVLVVGVAQIALAAGQAALSADLLSGRVVGLEAGGWTVANALVIAGTLAGIDALVYVGGALLVVALAIFAYAVRGTAGSLPRLADQHMRWLLYTFRAVVFLLLVSIPIGLVLATVRGDG
jgi:hypothetical protein